MDFKNEQFRLGRLFGYMVALSVENDGNMSFDDWISRSNQERDWYGINVKPEMLCDFMGIYCGDVNIIEFDGIEYCFAGEYELIDDNLESGFGIVCIIEGKFKYYNNEEFMKDVIRGDNKKVDRLKEFIE